VLTSYYKKMIYIRSKLTQMTKGEHITYD